MKNYKKLLGIGSPIHFLAVGLGSGLSPIIPGTCGTVMAVFLWVLLLNTLTLPWYLFNLIFCFIVGIFICGFTEKALDSDDPGCIVWDEFVGLWLTFLAFYAMPEMQHKVYWILLGFILFRIFDMVKPWPIRSIDRKISGGFGIMLDDILAGVFAGLLLWGIYLLI